jgi:hypothetical protein
MSTEIREAKFAVECFACGAKYRPKWLYVDGKECTGVSDHVCNPRRLARAEARLRREWDEDEYYCECDDLDCKFEFLDSIKNEMQ